MWGEKIIDSTLKYIFQHNFQVDKPGGCKWFIRPRKPHKRFTSSKQYNRVVSFLRILMSWKFGELLDLDFINECELLSWFITYIETNHNELFLFKTYEEYEF